MLIMFKVKNYASFKEEAVLDLRATSLKQHSTHVIQDYKKNKLLKTAAIYGANASGKSNLIQAMWFFKFFITSQLLLERKKENELDFEIFKNFKFKTFQLCENRNEIAEFEINFVKNDKIIQYGFECSNTKVVKEWYYIENKKVYNVENGKVSFGINYKEYLLNYKKIPANGLYLAALDYYLDAKTKDIVLKDFLEFINEEFNISLDFIFESTIKASSLSEVKINKKLIIDEDYRKRVADYLKKIDVGIHGLEVSKIVFNDPITNEEKKVDIIKTVHNVYDQNEKIVEVRKFNLSQESSGTLRFLSFIQSIIEIMEKGGIFIVDEFTARLHPLLTKLIIDIVQSKDNNNSQLIFTTHEITILNKDQFRRDEVVFIEKDSTGASSIFALSDLNIREDASFGKNYLHGEYGAIPNFIYKDFFGDD